MVRVHDVWRMFDGARTSAWCRRCAGCVSDNEVSSERRDVEDEKEQDRNKVRYWVEQLEDWYEPCPKLSGATSAVWTPRNVTD